MFGFLDSVCLTGSILILFFGVWDWAWGLSCSLICMLFCHLWVVTTTFFFPDYNSTSERGTQQAIVIHALLSPSILYPQLMLQKGMNLLFCVWQTRPAFSSLFEFPPLLLSIASLDCFSINCYSEFWRPCFCVSLAWPLHKYMHPHLYIYIHFSKYKIKMKTLGMELVMHTL